jgi:NADH:ubiquinone oxidoreductase subunit H
MTVLEVVIRTVAVLVAFLVLPLLVGQTEHKVMAHMQGRLGPMYAGGFHGWAQLVADGVKFVQKEDVVPVAADRWVFRLAPGVALVPYLVAMSVIPLGPNLVGADVDAGALFVVALAGIGILGTLMAGWSSANKYSLLGAMRSAAQLLSYELPIVLSVASVALAPARCRSAASSASGAGGGWSGSCLVPSCSSWRRWPSCSGRRSTCRSPTRRSSSAPTPNTPGCGSPSSCCRSMRASS